jgi:hypothetical protein
VKFSLKPFKCNHANQSVPRFSINVTGLASLKRKRGLEAELVNHNIQDSFLLHEESSNRIQSKKVEQLFEIIITLNERSMEGVATPHTIVAAPTPALLPLSK